MNKICTSIEQSKKLIELGIDINTADMCWAYRNDVDRYFLYVKNSDTPEERLCQIVPYEKDVPAWSLAALLDVIPYIIVNDEGEDLKLHMKKDDLQYYLFYENEYTGELCEIETDLCDDMIDACYEMIVKLKEMDLL